MNRDLEAESSVGASVPSVAHCHSFQDYSGRISILSNIHRVLFKLESPIHSTPRLSLKKMLIGIRCLLSD